MGVRGEGGKWRGGRRDREEKGEGEGGGEREGVRRNGEKRGEEKRVKKDMGVPFKCFISIFRSLIHTINTFFNDRGKRSLDNPSSKQHLIHRFDFCRIEPKMSTG